MADKAPKQPAEMSAGAKYALIGTIATAVIGLIGTGLTLYFNYLEKVEPQKLSLHATQTVEARLTQAALNATPTFAATPTQTSSPVEIPSPTFTLTVSPAPATPTPTPTFEGSGVKYCVDVHALNVRTGPGTVFDISGILNQGDCLAFDAYVLLDGVNYWVHITPGQPGFTAVGGMWVYGQYLRPQDFDQRLPEVTPLPFPTPTMGPVG